MKVTLQSWVARRYGWKLGVEAGESPAWGSGRFAWNHEAPVSSRMRRGPRPPAFDRGGPIVSPSLSPSRPMLPARTVRTPRPQQNWPRASRY